MNTSAALSNDVVDTAVAVKRGRKFDTDGAGGTASGKVRALFAEMTAADPAVKNKAIAAEANSRFGIAVASANVFISNIRHPKVGGKTVTAPDETVNTVEGVESVEASEVVTA